MRAAIDARQDLDVLRDAAPAGGEQPKLNDAAKVAGQATKIDSSVKNATTKEGVVVKKDLLSSDPQLSAALLLLRLELTGTQS